MTTPSFGEPAASARRCPRCGAAVTPGTDECPACQQSLCPACGAAVGPHWPSCIACGARWDLLCPECEGVVLPRHKVCPHCGADLDSAQDEGYSPTPQPAEDQELLPAMPASGPACSVCGRQDETLRLVSLPYVVSLVFMTFRRSFAGLWCRRHRNQRLALAGLITGVAGWIGIPFGLFFTPLALVKLARGGDQPLEHNQRLLEELAGHKLRVGDGPGAVRCLEESLRLKDDEAGRVRLALLYEEQQVSTGQGRSRSFWPFMLAALVSSGLGIGLGLAQGTILLALGPLFGQTANLFLVILTWTPWIAALFLGGLALIQIVERTLRAVACRQVALGLGLSWLLAAMMLYGAMQGRVILEMLPLQLSGEDLSLLGGPLFPWLILAAGPILEVPALLEAGTLYGVLFASILLVAAVYYLWAATSAARSTVRWQQALASVQAGGRPVRFQAIPLILPRLASAAIRPLAPFSDRLYYAREMLSYVKLLNSFPPHVVREALEAHRVLCATFDYTPTTLQMEVARRQGPGG